MKGLNEKYLKELEIEQQKLTKRYLPISKRRYEERILNNENINKERINRSNQILFG